MKKYLKYFAPAAALLALVAFILMLATPGVVQTSGNSQYNYPGTTVLFGGDVTFLWFTGHITLAWSALIAWILLIVSFVAIVAMFVLEMLKIKVLDKYSQYIKLGAAALLLVAGIFVFVSSAAFTAVNEFSGSGYGLGVGWVFAGILTVLAAIVAAVPSVLALIKK